MMQLIPFYQMSASAGFPSPAEPYSESSLDIAMHLIKHPAATFFIRSSGDSMSPMISSGDILVVDRSLNPRPGDICIVSLNGGLYCKSVYADRTPIELRSYNPDSETITVDENSFESGGCEIWGVVSSIIRELN